MQNILYKKQMLFFYNFFLVLKSIEFSKMETMKSLYKAMYFQQKFIGKKCILMMPLYLKKVFIQMPFGFFVLLSDAASNIL